MRILIAGASGFLGSHLRTSLTLAGHDVTTLVRRAPGTGEIRWDPYTADLDPAAIESTDVVINLAGSPTLGNPHSKKWASELLESRVTTTRVLADAVAASTRRPALLAGNGISYYGDRGAELLTESASSQGDALLTEVTRQWQAAAAPAADAGARVVILRTAPVLDAAAPPLKQLLLLFKAGLGGKLSAGDQYFPIISTEDWLAAVRFCAENDAVSGPVNLVCPQVPTNAEFTAALASLVRRPAIFGVPGPVLKVAAGKMAPELLGSVRAVPQTLLDAGFRFADQDVTAVLRAATS